MVIDGKDKDVLVVAEISANHGQSLRRALTLVKKAKECGADAVKFQAYTPDTLTIDCRNKYFKIRHSEWGGQTLYDLYKKAYTPWKWFKILKKTADALGLIFFATAFDRSSVDFLEEVGVPCHKIASFELVDLELITYAARTGKPVILSTGMATLAEISQALKAAKINQGSSVTLLKCVSAYPADPSNMNLLTIKDMQKRFKVPIGISDHSLGIGVSIAAVSLGAVMVERHFALSRNIKTCDSFFSLEPEELKCLVKNIRDVYRALGRVNYGASRSEKKNAAFRRSLFAVADIKAGERLTRSNVRSIRPGYGLAPKFMGRIMGRRSKMKIKRGNPITWDLI